MKAQHEILSQGLRTHSTSPGLRNGEFFNHQILRQITSRLRDHGLDILRRGVEIAAQIELQRDLCGTLGTRRRHRVRDVRPAAAIEEERIRHHIRADHGAYVHIELVIAPEAMQEGRYVAAAIRRRLRGAPNPPFRYIDKGSLATIGRAAAVARFGRLECAGFFARSPLELQPIIESQHDKRISDP